MAKKILFILDSLRAGGRERRALELFEFLKKETDFVFQIVLIENIIHYDYVFDLNVPLIVLKERKFKKDFSKFYPVLQIVKSFKPDLIHAWSGMAALYAIPAAKYYKIPLINSQVADSHEKRDRPMINNILLKINKQFSSIILSNSHAGMRAYGVKSNEGAVIHNGINMNRFRDLPEREDVKKQFCIQTPFSVIMVASFNKYKEYAPYFKSAKLICDRRDDVTFIAVGEGALTSEFNKEFENHDRILLFDKILHVEQLINVVDIGILLSTLHAGEGISNTIMEYMALYKPVIATDAGGTPELVVNNQSGFLVKNDIDQIVQLIILLLNAPELRIKMGENGRKIIEHNFTINRMGVQFIDVYKSLTRKQQ